MGGRVKPGIELRISYSNTMLNYRFSQKFKLLENGEFNHLTVSLTKQSPVVKGKKKKKLDMGIFGSLNSSIFPLQFSLHFGEKNFWWTRAHILFSFPLTQPNTLKKVFLLIFSPKFSIYPISLLNKHTLTKELSWKSPS